MEKKDSITKEIIQYEYPIKPGAVSEERNLTFSGRKRKDLYSEILFVFKSYQADKISLFILGKSVRRGKISPAVVSDPGVDAVVPKFKTGG